LPQTARAVVNCRVLPQSSVAATRAVIESIAAPYNIAVLDMAPATPSPPSPLDPEVLGPVTALADSMWPGIAVIPEMSTGASDGAYTRNAGIPTYTVSAIASDPNDMRAHGQDERIGVKAFRDSSNFWYELVKTLSLP
jgi:acetylornithine deacetylase/succinyl-diaminopimelate desuccinylase-like protein